MFLIKNTFYVDCVTNLYTKPVNNCGFVITDPTNELFHQDVGEFNIDDIHKVSNFSFLDEKFILYVSEYDYVLLYNSLIKKILDVYPCLKPFADDIYKAQKIHIMSDMELQIHSETIDLTQLDISNLHELSYEFLIPVLYITKPRIDRFIKEKLNNFIGKWKSHLHQKCYTKILQYFIYINSDKLDMLLSFKKHDVDSFNMLLKMSIMLKSEQSDLFGEIYDEILFLHTFANNWESLVDFLISHQVRYVQSGNYKYNEYLINILSKAVQKNDSTCNDTTQ